LETREPAERWTYPNPPSLVPSEKNRRNQKSAAPREGDTGLGWALRNPDHTGDNDPYITGPTSSQIQIGGDRLFP
jgi:hypothetical protein